MVHIRWFASLLCLLGLATAPALAQEVRIEPTPAQGQMPHVQVEANGTVHMIYMVGEAPGPADVYYVHRPAGETRFSEPIRVNSEDGSGYLAGAMRAAQLAVGVDGRVHVAWMGSPQGRIAGPEDTLQTPMLYTRLNDAADAFEPQRNVVQHGFGIDGGGTVAADGQGRVYVIWHAFGDTRDEADRQVYVARSEDEGQTFERERGVLEQRLGVCHCCGLNAGTDAAGNVHVLLRAATDGVGRGSWLLRSSDGGRRFAATELEPWEIDACMMSTFALASNVKPDSLAVAWEAKNRVAFATMAADGHLIGGPFAATGGGNNQRHPALAVNEVGQILLAWAEERRGGSQVVWQLYAADGTPVGGPERGPRIGPAHRIRLAAVAEADGSFTVYH